MTSPEWGDRNLENPDWDRSEYRRRFLQVKNRLAELRAKYGHDPPSAEALGVECDPSWGPVGSLASRLMESAAVGRLRAWDDQLTLLERQRAKADADE